MASRENKAAAGQSLTGDHDRETNGDALPAVGVNGQVGLNKEATPLNGITLIVGVIIGSHMDRIDRDVQSFGQDVVRILALLGSLCFCGIGSATSAPLCYCEMGSSTLAPSATVKWAPLRGLWSSTGISLQLDFVLIIRPSSISIVAQNFVMLISPSSPIPVRKV